jgi:hypothetical protein
MARLDCGLLLKSATIRRAEPDSVRFSTVVVPVNAGLAVGCTPSVVRAVAADTAVSTPLVVVTTN